MNLAQHRIGYPVPVATPEVKREPAPPFRVLNEPLSPPNERIDVVRVTIPLLPEQPVSSVEELDFVVIKRKAGANHNPLRTECVGGKVDARVDPRKACDQEVLEEIGLKGLTLITPFVIAQRRHLKDHPTKKQYVAWHTEAEPIDPAEVGRIVIQESEVETYKIMHLLDPRETDYSDLTDVARAQIRLLRENTWAYADLLADFVEIIPVHSDSPKPTREQAVA